MDCILMTSRPALVSSQAVAHPPPPRRAHCCLFLNATCASNSSCVLASAGRTRSQPQPRLVAAQSPPPLAAGVVQRDAEAGLAFLAFVVAVVCIYWFAAFIFLV